MKVFFLCVLYSTPPLQSSTVTSLSNAFKSFKSNNDFKFIFWDNSPQGFDSNDLKTLFTQEQILHVHTGENKSLSSIYNHVALKFKREFDVLVILDDDSQITAKYLSNLTCFFKEDTLVAIPKIHNNNQLISPGFMHGVRGVQANKKQINNGVIPSKGLVAMMSGTAIKSDVFFKQNIYFNEDLSFYGVDTRFFLDYQKLNSEIFIMNLSLTHQSALRDLNLTIEEQIKRFSNLMQAQFLIHNSTPWYKVKLFFFFPAFILKKCITRKSFRFIRLFKNYYLFFKR